MIGISRISSYLSSYFQSLWDNYAWWNYKWAHSGKQNLNINNIINILNVTVKYFSHKVQFLLANSGNEFWIGMRKIFISRVFNLFTIGGGGGLWTNYAISMILHIPPNRDVSGIFWLGGHMPLPIEPMVIRVTPTVASVTLTKFRRDELRYWFEIDGHHIENIMFHLHSIWGAPSPPSERFPEISWSNLPLAATHTQDN